MHITVLGDQQEAVTLLSEMVDRMTGEMHFEPLQLETSLGG
jgi:hypothetical protein